MHGSQDATVGSASGTAGVNGVPDGFAEAWLAGWNTHNPDALAALCHPDIEWDEPAPRRRLLGREQIRAWFVQNFVAFPDLHIELVEEFVDRARGAAASRWTLTGTHEGPLDPPGFAATGRRVEVKGADFMAFRDGLLAEMHMIYDVSDLGVQLGLAPPPGSVLERSLVRMQRAGARLRR